MNVRTSPAIPAFSAGSRVERYAVENATSRNTVAGRYATIATRNCLLTNSTTTVSTRICARAKRRTHSDAGSLSWRIAAIDHVAKLVTSIASRVAVQSTVRNGLVEYSKQPCIVPPRNEAAATDAKKTTNQRRSTASLACSRASRTVKTMHSIASAKSVRLTAGRVSSRSTDVLLRLTFQA